MGCVLGSKQGVTDKCVRPGGKESGKFANLTDDSNWETLAQRRKMACICALYKAHSTESSWEDRGDILQRPYYPSQVDHDRKIRNRRQTIDIRKYSFVNRTIQFCNKLPMNA
jgi:hypothetical protein